MPAEFTELATEAAARAGFAVFAPDACLINQYEPGSRLSLHQDKDEQDYGAPIVSVSLGLPAYAARSACAASCICMRGRRLTARCSHGRYGVHG